MIYKDVTQLVGNTPLLEIADYTKENQLSATLLAKLEYLNPAGSVKDRVALRMIQDAEAAGKLLPGATIIEPTSGNTGIGLAMVATVKGYPLILTMPDSMSEERRQLLKAYGAKLVLTPGAQGMQGALDKADQLAREIPGSFIPAQFDNPSNPAAHRDTTGPEIWKDTEGNVDIFVAGVGTGGTITGVGHYLKEQNPDVEIVAVEPADSPLLSGGAPGPHPLQGIGANFIPSILDTSLIDTVFPVTGPQAFEAGRQLAATQGLLVGISSGAALYAATQLAKEKANHGKNIVVLLPDTGDRYLSTDYFA